MCVGFPPPQVLTPALPQGRVVARTSLRLPAGRPRAFLLTGLVPGHRHVVMISGVARPDALTRFALVRTLTGSESRVRMVAVAGNSASGPQEGPSGVWARVNAAVQAGEVDVVLHTGGQVGAPRCFDTIPGEFSMGDVWPCRV